MRPDHNQDDKQDDLFGHLFAQVNGRWLAETEIPADRSTYACPERCGLPGTRCPKLGAYIQIRCWFGAVRTGWGTVPLAPTTRSRNGQKGSRNGPAGAAPAGGTAAAPELAAASLPRP
ncbi:hypothetical protein E7Y31_23480 [Candidatus Frankia alpina]|uniref:Uncharacterized protein n=1 Tax=Candidatus Frankia alpina TaxID=2699483 RepID=A0A4S5B9T6_9ACTN|nr:hypothetical protein E7Y31_23480 [Candidatus Frankia alpina]